MNSSDRIDLLFVGSFSYLEGDEPVRAEAARLGSPTERLGRRVLHIGDSCRPRPAAAPAADDGGADRGAPAARPARPRHKEEAMTSLRSSEVLAARHERREALGWLGRQGRLAAYRRGEFDFEVCCLWAARYPDEVPLLNGEFEFIARFTPEVCE